MDGDRGRGRYKGLIDQDVERRRERGGQEEDGDCRVSGTAHGREESRLTIILALHTGHDFLHEILTGNSELLQVQELANGGSRSFGVVLGDDENGRWDGRLGCLGLEEELRGRVSGIHTGGRCGHVECRTRVEESFRHRPVVSPSQ